MKQIDRSLLPGFALVAAGILFLAQSLGWLGALAALIWAVAFGAGGVAFLVALVRNSARWWAAIPGFVLLGIALLIALGELAPAFVADWGGALFLAMVSLGFWVVYLICRACWWGIIPGGVLLTLALVTGMSENMPGQDLGWVFFLGLSATFGILYLQPMNGRRVRWALYPSAVLLMLALLVLTATGELAALAWPLALIAIGCYLMYRTLRPRHT
jgi:hypothetical protein